MAYPKDGAAQVVEDFLAAPRPSNKRFLERNGAVRGSAHVDPDGSWLTALLVRARATRRADALIEKRGRDKAELRAAHPQLLEPVVTSAPRDEPEESWQSR